MGSSRDIAITLIAPRQSLNECKRLFTTVDFRFARDLAQNWQFDCLPLTRPSHLGATTSTGLRVTLTFATEFRTFAEGGQK